MAKTATAARAIWKGRIRLDGADVPVKLFSAVEDRAAVRFRLLHEKDLVPVAQKMVSTKTGKRVELADARRAYASDDGSFVILTAEELEALAPEPSRDVEVLRFVEATALDPAWYDRPYYLGPDGAARRYFALASVLRNTGRVGLVRWVMRKKEYRGCLRPSGKHLILVTLHAAEEMVPAAELAADDGRELAKNELKMAAQLIEAMTEPFVPEDHADRYRARVQELIEAKASGKVVELKKHVRRAPARDLAKALEASLQRAKERRRA